MGSRIISYTYTWYSIYVLLKNTIKNRYNLQIMYSYSSTNRARSKFIVYIKIKFNIIGIYILYI